ncbi:hypothetical protein EVAR_47913_1 [Eumeta japonica]|uniref:Uncharacterized protein n=1 Tax=Eumeta variegata TaxID=151549 RepID=A0A4C1Y4V1_EUMVA|nr:hypothetical protein EVAR_47913_1 [Eumeta japonica]
MELEKDCMALTSQNSDVRSEKRKEREEDTNSEESFIEVRRNRKRYLRSGSLNQYQVEQSLVRSEEMPKYEICVTSKKELPKQMALVKLLRNENICNISNIKYKSPFKVLICFENNNDAIKLVENEKFKQLEFSCRKTLETTMTYGLIRGVDLECTEEEILTVMKSEIKTLAINRLKRLDFNGKWVESESVRKCFEGKTLPTYVPA